MRKYRKSIIKRVVVLAVVLFVLLSAYTLTMMYYPVQERLRQEERLNFELGANNKKQVLEEVTDQYQNVASSLSSRSAIRDAMVSYQKGEMKYNEMLAFVEPRYMEGIAAFGDLKGITYVARVMNGTVIIEKGRSTIDVIKHIDEHLSVDKIHLEMVGDFVLCVIAPILNGKEKVGYDLVLADLTYIIEELKEEIYTIRLFQEKMKDEDDTGKLVVESRMDKLDMFFQLSVDEHFIYGEGDGLLRRLLFVFALGLLLVFVVVTISILRFSNRMLRTIQEKEETLRIINGVTGEGIWDWHIQENRVYHNEKWCTLFGMDNNFLVHETQTFLDRIYPDDLSLVEKRIKEAHESGIAYSSEHRMTRLDGNVIWVKDRGAVVDYDHKRQQAIRMVGSLQDITRRKMAEEELFQEKELFRTTLQSVGDGVIATDVHGKIQLINPVAQKLTGWTEEEAFGKEFSEVFHLIHDKTREVFEGLIQKVLESGEVVFLGQDLLLVRSDGVEIPIEDSTAPIRNQQQEIIGAVVVFRDFSEKKEKLGEIEYLSLHDHLTGLYNRRYVEDAMRHMDTPRNLPFSVMILDVNGLKKINDCYGHQAGDELIQAAAKAMEKACRSDDIIARIGGDEFMVLLPKTTQEEANQIGQRIQAFAKEHRDQRYTVSLAFGCGTKMRLEEE